MWGNSSGMISSRKVDSSICAKLALSTHTMSSRERKFGSEHTRKRAIINCIKITCTIWLKRYWHAIFFPAPNCGPIFSRNVTGYKPMSEGNATAGRRPEHAWARRQETAATAGTLSSLIDLQPIAFWVKIGPLVGVEKHIECNKLICMLNVILVVCRPL